MRVLLMSILLGALATTRADDWGPQSLPGLTHWLQPQAGVTVDAAGGISRWSDQSGHGNDLVQDDPARRPRLVREAANGQGAAFFDGEDDALELVRPITAAGKSVIAVVKWNEVRGYSFAIGLDSGTDGYLRMDGPKRLVLGGPYPVIYETGAAAPKDCPPGYGRKVFHFMPRALTEWNVFAVTDNPARPEKIKYLGQNEHNNQPGARFAGQVAALLIYDRALSDGERRQLEGYLCAKYLGRPPLSDDELVAAPAAPVAAVAAVPGDPHIRNHAGSEVQLIRIRPQKLFNWRGAEVTGVVELANSGTVTRNVQVQVHLAADLGRRSGDQQQTLSLAPAARHETTFSWSGDTVGKWGHAMVVEVVADDQPVAGGEAFFGVADELWEICIPGTHPLGYTATHARNLKDIEQRVEAFRDKYLNVFEKFFWAPDDFGDMTPTRETWFSGQARYHEHLGRLLHLCDYGWQVGVIPTTYGKNIGSGAGARDLIRRWPELVYGYGGVMDFHPDTEELAKWDIAADDPAKEWQSIGWAHYNMNDPAVVQHGINQIIASTEQFGWAAVRFDGHFRARAGRQRVGDKQVVFSIDDADRQTAANMRALKDQARAKFPRYAFGYNYAECGFDRRLETQPRETIELCAGNGLIMDEYARSNNDGAHPYRNWSDFAAMLVRESEQSRRLGGVLLPLVGGGLLGRYQTLMIYAAGAHPGMAAPHTVDHPYNAFATRYSAVLWHPDLRNLWNPNGLVIVSSQVWWENYVRVQDIDASQRRLIIHLINPPPAETAVETAANIGEEGKRSARRREIAVAAAAQQTAADFSEVDDLPPLALTPAPKTDLPVRIVPQAFARPWQAKRAWLLDPETAAEAELTIDQSDRYFWEVRVPEVRFWAVVVFELAVQP